VRDGFHPYILAGIICLGVLGVAAAFFVRLGGLQAVVGFLSNFATKVLGILGLSG
jgi:hypothetical protein